MELEECNTVKSCLFWAEQRWKGFWDFATQQAMTSEEIYELAAAIDKDDDGFDALSKRLVAVAKLDKTKEAMNLLFKGAGAFCALEEKLNEARNLKR